ncbi:hypothetical protein HY409_03105 [Candidatus Gottesmanbacteria bacterium]|nr:hypothetical protein [Candidatus Gottesmanbacteria bacterium]
MAKARMLHKKISVSLQVDRLSLGAQLLFSWMIPAADDEGRMKGEPQSVKANVVPMKKWTFTKVKDYLNEMKNQGLIYYWEQNGEWIIEFPKWNEYQQIRKDRLEPSKLPSFSGKNVNQQTGKSQPDDNQTTAQSSVSESNPVEINKSEYSDKDLIADKNTSYKKEQATGKDFDPSVDVTLTTSNAFADRNPDAFDPKNAGEVAALEVWKRLEPNNRWSFYSTYLKPIRKGFPPDKLYQTCSEIEQDPSVENPGKIMNTRVKTYFEEKGIPYP